MIEVKNLSSSYKVSSKEFFKKNIIRAVEDVSITIPENHTLGLVGESGCGKSQTALSIMRLIQKPGKIVGGEVLFKNENLLNKSESQMRDILGNQMAMIFQEPMTSLNPVYTIGDQVEESIRLHQKNISALSQEKRCAKIKPFYICTRF